MRETPPRFFCDHCSKEVKRDTMICPHCGSFFVNVRCPSCGFTSTSDDFIAGCPECGYALEQDESKKTSKKKNKKASSKKKSPKSKKNYDNEKLPIWVYLLVVFILFAMIAFTVFYG